MKKLILVLMMLLIPASAFGVAAVVTSKVEVYEASESDARFLALVFSCVGHSTGGAILDTAISEKDSMKIRGWYVYRVIIENLAANASVTDDSDVYIKDASGTDLLNGQGVDMLDDDTRNYVRLCRKDPVLGILTLDVDNQNVNSGKYTVTLILAK